MFSYAQGGDRGVKLSVAYAKDISGIIILLLQFSLYIQLLSIWPNLIRVDMILKHVRVLEQPRHELALHCCTKNAGGFTICGARLLQHHTRTFVFLYISDPAGKGTANKKRVCMVAGAWHMCQRK